MPDGVNIGRRLGVKSRADRQIQRRKSFDGRHVVGGHAVLTTHHCERRGAARGPRMA